MQLYIIIAADVVGFSSVGSCNINIGKFDLRWKELFIVEAKKKKSNA